MAGKKGPLSVDEIIELRKAHVQAQRGRLSLPVPRELAVPLAVLLGFGVAFAVEYVYGDGEYDKVIALACTLAAALGLSMSRNLDKFSFWKPWGKQEVEASGYGQEVLSIEKANLLGVETKEVRKNIFRNAVGLNPTESQPESPLKWMPASNIAFGAIPMSSIKTSSSSSTPSELATSSLSSTRTPSSAAPSSSAVVASTPSNIVCADISVYSSPNTPVKAPREPQPSPAAALSQSTPGSVGTSSMLSSSALKTGSTSLSQQHSLALTLSTVSTPVKTSNVDTASVELNDENAALTRIQSLKSSDKDDNRPGVVLMEEWVSNFQRALIKYIQKHVLHQIDDIHNQLLSLNIFPKESLEWPEHTQGAEELYTQLNLNHTDRTRLEELFRRRKSIERFFSVRRRGDMKYFSKQYVLKRLQTLGKSDNLTGYIWDGGESFEGKSWDPELLPTDAEILFRVICIWMDNLLKRDERDKKSFTSLHVRDESKVSADELAAEEFWGFLNCGRFVNSTSSPLSTLAGSLSFINESSHFPTSQRQRTFVPHFKVVFRGEIWEVQSKRMNLFHCAVLFFYTLEKNKIARVQEFLKQIFARTKPEDIWYAY